MTILIHVCEIKLLMKYDLSNCSTLSDRIGFVIDNIINLHHDDVHGFNVKQV